MIDRTFSKWSSAARTLRATTDRMGLPRRPAASLRSSSARRSCVACRATPAPLPRNCRKEGGSARFRTTWLFCKPLRRRLAPQVGTTPVSNASRAWAIAVSSSALVFERPSHSVALSSQPSWRVWLNSLSAFIAFVSAVFSASASSFSSVLYASSFSFSSFSFSANFFSFTLSSFFVSKRVFESNSVWSKPALISMNLFRRPSSSARMSLAWYS
mmetsp:Transcript_144253/g.402026  ORF Transcript_144253/g.402026 Transcript_144253/m.402026 type:complete len:214 (+) Transcript_144253:929-1570(+)